ncbi:sulfatase [Humibacillus sp. DSM 29435]|uniref:sulfatase family protein n=1 Tax=Humibacillus sp. DSM 29435 TaxID=1869167 RepID=UPI00087244DD|nr:sulfatase-like hydrolase/transferase [Humibacillus sp. DSM 29435]OFE14278.1 sulfatase [Humibacillus sp. DSM 29435]
MSRPNIVLIVSDDHGYADRSSLGVVDDVQTPGLDRLAAEGMSFGQAYVTAPVCSPSRSALISGQHQGRWGAQWFADSRFPDHLPSLAERFGELGYRTAYLGKVHYGPEQVGDRATPPHHGFEHTFYGLAGQQMGRLNYLRHSDAAVAEYGEFGASASAVQPMLEGDEPVDCEEFLTTELGRRSREFVEGCADRDEPFFLMLAFNAVHNFCWQLPPDELRRRGLPSRDDYQGDEPEYLDWYDGQIAPELDHGRDYYVAQLELMDAEIGRLLGQLDSSGIADDTVVVYLTDNGGSTCNFASNAPLRGTKYTLWEGGIRVPLLVRWPGAPVNGGAQCSAVASSTDLYPTLLDLAGAPESAYDHCDGVSLRGALEGESTAGHEELHWDNGFQWAVRAGRWKMVSVDQDSDGVRGLRQVEHADPGPAVRLHDLVADPGEARNLATERPDVLAELESAHANWRTTVFASHCEPSTSDDQLFERG